MIVVETYWFPLLFYFRKEIKKGKYARYSIESIHLLPYDSLLTHLLPLEISFCTLQRALQHAINVAFLLIVFSQYTCIFKQHRGNTIWQLFIKRKSVLNISWFNYTSSIHSSWLTFLPAHINFTSWILVLVLCLLLHIDDFLLLDLMNIQYCTLYQKLVKSN